MLPFNLFHRSIPDLNTYFDPPRLNLKETGFIVGIFYDRLGSRRMSLDVPEKLPVLRTEFRNRFRYKIRNARLSQYDETTPLVFFLFGSGF
jgi:hypothetical protein